MIDMMLDESVKEEEGYSRVHLHQIPIPTKEKSAEPRKKIKKYDNSGMNENEISAKMKTVEVAEVETNSNNRFLNM